MDFLKSTYPFKYWQPSFLLLNHLKWNWLTGRGNRWGWLGEEEREETKRIKEGGVWGGRRAFPRGGTPNKKILQGILLLKIWILDGRAFPRGDHWRRPQSKYGKAYHFWKLELLAGDPCGEGVCVRSELGWDQQETWDRHVESSSIEVTLNNAHLSSESMGVGEISWCVSTINCLIWRHGEPICKMR